MISIDGGVAVGALKMEWGFWIEEDVVERDSYRRQKVGRRGNARKGEGGYRRRIKGGVYARQGNVSTLEQDKCLQREA
jgi:hypothetical protein